MLPTQPVTLKTAPSQPENQNREQNHCSTGNEVLAGRGFPPTERSKIFPAVHPGLLCEASKRPMTCMVSFTAIVDLSSLGNGKSFAIFMLLSLS